MRIEKPGPGEFAPFHKGYIDLCPNDGALIEHLKSASSELSALALSLSESQTAYRYAEGKWDMKEILLHLTDAERVFAYRALRFARRDQTPLPGFDENPYVLYSRADERSVEDILEEFEAQRRSTVALYKSFDEESWKALGTANDKPVSVRAIGYITLGHHLNHFKVYKERYLGEKTASL